MLNYWQGHLLYLQDINFFESKIKINDQIGYKNEYQVTVLNRVVLCRSYPLIFTNFRNNFDRSDQSIDMTSYHNCKKAVLITKH